MSAGNSASNNGETAAETSAWTKDEKTKTCKCEACGDRVRFWSYKCSKCGRRICSECLDPGSGKTQYAKDVAKDHIDVGCWCMYRSNMNPAFRQSKPPPPVRTEEEFKARESKGLVTSRAGRKAASAKKPTATKARHTDASPSPGPAEDSGREAPDDNYETSENLKPTLTEARNKRSGVKRRLYIEPESDDDVFNRPNEHVTATRPKEWLQAGHAQLGDEKMRSGKSSKRAKLSHLSDQALPISTSSYAAHLAKGNTVIAGAGFVGLFIARELALDLHQAGIEHNITVVDLRSNSCQLASGHCAGFLTTAGMPENWLPIAEAAREAWQDILSSVEFRQQLSFDTNSLYTLTATGGVNQDRVPFWLQVDSTSSLLEDFKALGRIDPEELAFWLHEQCKALGVQFRFNNGVSHPKFSKSGRLIAIDLEDVLDDDRSPERIKCDNLVLAAGPFTTWLFGDCFQQHLVELDNRVQTAQWCHAAVNDMDGAGDVGLSLAGGVPSTGKTLEVGIRMVSRPTTRIIQVSGWETGDRNTKVHPQYALQPNTGRVREVRAAAAEYLDGIPDIQEDARGRSLTSTANGGNPIIDKVPVSGLGRMCDEELDRDPCGVWLCYGLGKHGTMLAPGAAHMLVSKMVGRPSEHDGYDFSLPMYSRPEAKGKGKNKVRS